MSDLDIIRQARARRAARAAAAQRAKLARRRRLARRGAAGLAAAAAVALAILAVDAEPAHHHRQPRAALATPAPGPLVAHRPSSPAPSRYGRTPAAAMVPAKVKLPLRSGLLFDVRTGRVLWERNPATARPIASLTKMMTALVVTDHARAGEQVKITRDALRYSGSGVGMLPLGRMVTVRTLLYGLLLPSGNDAAIALALHVAGSQARFIAMMNVRARRMRLTCTHFSTVSGIVDQGNYSCASDLAVIAGAVLRQPLLRGIVATRDAVLPMPIKGGKVFLYNNNELLRLRYPGTDGVKTGFTTLAGPCLVASARRGGRWLAVVLLNSASPAQQAMTLLNAGFAAPAA
jgi:D-alanyl-D-alanine carboxypeptidase